MSSIRYINFICSILKRYFVYLVVQFFHNYKTFTIRAYCFTIVTTKLNIVFIVKQIKLINLVFAVRAIFLTVNSLRLHEHKIWNDRTWNSLVSQIYPIWKYPTVFWGLCGKRMNIIKLDDHTVLTHIDKNQVTSLTNVNLFGIYNSN